MYECLILRDPETDVTTEQLAAELRRFYKGEAGSPDEVAVSGHDLSVRWAGYTLQVGRSSLPHVLEESAELLSLIHISEPTRLQ